VQHWYPAAFDLLRMNSDWLWLVDADGNLVEWRSSLHPDKNEAPAGGYGFWKNILRDDRTLRDDKIQLLRAVREGKSFRCFKIACQMPHLGVRGWLRVSGVPVMDETGVVKGYRGAGVNITGQMMTSRKLERVDKHTKNLMLVLDASPLAVFMANLGKPGWPITYFNAALAELSGCAAGEITGKDALFMADNAADELIVEMLRERVSKGLQTTQRVSLARKDGSTFWGEMILIPGCSEGGGCTLMVIVRNVEAEMAYHAAELQRSRLHALGELAGGMAHEINNLLQPACLNTEILAGDFEPDHPSQELLKDITTGLDQIRYIVRNTLQFSRKDVSAGRMAEELPVEFAPLLEERLMYLRHLLPATVSLNLGIAAKTDGTASINPTEFTQVLTNLLTNASHAMKGKGGIAVALKKVVLDGVREQREALPLGSYFVLSVSDTGCGMSESVAARIFEPFFTTKAVGEGTGLGLSVVYGIVTRWGGTISVQSSPGNGTTFTLYVPEHVGNAALTGTDHLQRGAENGYVI